MGQNQGCIGKPGKNRGCQTLGWNLVLAPVWVLPSGGNCGALLNQAQGKKRAKHFAEFLDRIKRAAIELNVADLVELVEIEPNIAALDRFRRARNRGCQIWAEHELGPDTPVIRLETLVKDSNTRS